MKGHARFGLTVGVAAFAAIVSNAEARAAEDPKLRADLQALAQRSVFFGHQSVGENILDGVEDLAGQAGIPLRIVDAKSAVEVTAGTFVHGAMAENGNPLMKLQSFEQALGAGPSAVEIAFLKFCFVDITKDSDPRAIFASYREKLEQLRARHPRTTFVHVTVPLTGVQSGWKALVKSLLGRAPYGFEENARREAFNALMRQTYRGREALFDLAHIEATTPNGLLESAEVDGRHVPVLVSAYTDDGGHLNVEGRRRVARRLIELLASLPRRPNPSTADGRQ